MGRQANRRLGPLLLALPFVAVAGLFAVRLFWPLGPVDDAWITFRYARNLAAGLGPVFNPGERVEGFSSPLWLALLWLPARLGIDLAGFSKLAGATAAALAMLLVARRGADNASRGATLAILAASPAFLYHSVNGLETALVALLFAALALSGIEQRRRGALVPLVAAALVLARPEGFALVLAAQASWIVVRRREGLALRPLVAATATFAAATVLRWLWYGDWMANSARAKLLPLAFALPGGLSDLARFLWPGGAFGALVAFAIVAVVAARPAGGGKDEETLEAGRRTTELGLLLLLVFPLLAAGGGDSFPLWRFLVPTLPLLALLSGEGVARAAAAAASTGRGRLAVGTLVTAAVVANLLFPLPGYLQAARGEAAWVARWGEVGRALAAAVPKGSSIALCPVGAIPFQSGLRTVDMLGLTHRGIARVPPDTGYFYPGHQRHDAALVLASSPDLVLLANGPVVERPSDDFPWGEIRPYEADLARHPDFARDYGMTHLPLPGGGWVKIFAKRSLLGAASAPGATAVQSAP